MIQNQKIMFRRQAKYHSILLVLSLLFVTIAMQRIDNQSQLSGKKPQYTVENKILSAKKILKLRFDSTVYGKASWYGHPFHGRLTANGETYDMNVLSAAHKFLPFDTMVKVTNLRNGETVVVRINDRGPYIRGRHIDLSFAAAEHLGMVGTGVVPVKLQILRNRGKFEYRAPILAKR